MTRTMYDSTVLADIPLTCQIAAVYGTGKYKADPAAVERRFPSARYAHAWIDVDGSDPGGCSVLDVEPYDAPPKDAPGWIRKRHQLVKNALPTVYCNRSTIDPVASACAAAGLKLGRDWWLWVATLDGTLYQGAGVVACQDRGANQTHANYDASIVYEDWWHSLPAPPKPPVQPVTLAAAKAAQETVGRYLAQG